MTRHIQRERERERDDAELLADKSHLTPKQPALAGASEIPFEGDVKSFPNLEEQNPYAGDKDTEITSERTYNQKVYDLGGNKRRYIVHAGQIHYKENGQFKDVDTHLRQVNGGWVMDKHNYHITIPEYADEIFDFYNAYEGADHHIKMKPVANHAKGELNYDEKYVLYRNAFSQNIDFKVQLTSRGVRKTVIVNENPGTDLFFDFELILDAKSSKLKKGIKDKADIKVKDKKIDLTGQVFRFGEEKSSFISQATVWDSSEQPKMENVKLELFKEKNKLYLRKTIPRQFFDDAVFPVITDHPTNYLGSTADGYVRNSGDGWDATHDAVTGDDVDSSFESNASGISSTQTGPTTYRIYRSFFYFNTSGINDGDTVTACDLKLYGSTTSAFTVHAQKGTQADTLTTADYDAFSGSSYGSVVWAEVAQYNSITFNATGRSEIDKTGTTKIVARTNADYVDSYSAEKAGVYYADDPGSNGDNRDPYLDITATASNNAPTISSVTDSPDPSGTSNELTFSVDWNDADAEGIKMYICKAEDGGTSGCGGGGTWCSNSDDFDTTDPITCTYTTQSADIGTNNYYAYVCDDEPSCSAATSGTFTVNPFMRIKGDAGGLRFKGGYTIK